MGRPVVRFEIGAHDKEKASDFYRSVFDWEIGEGPIANDVVTGEGHAIEGAITSLAQEWQNYVMVYMEVPNADEACAKIEAAGGKIAVGPLEIPGGKGRFAWFTDPEGNKLAIWEAPA